MSDMAIFEVQFYFAGFGGGLDYSEKGSQRKRSQNRS